MEASANNWWERLRPPARDQIFVASSGSLAVALAILAWQCFGGPKSTPTYTHMHCPVCEEEYPYNPQAASLKCGSCGHGGFIATAGPFKEAGEDKGIWTKLILFTLVASILVQGWAYVAVLRLKALRRADEETRTQVMVCRCPYCGRKVGFPAFKSGSAGTCPRCKTAFVLAANEQAV